MLFFENIVNDAVAEFKVNFLKAFKDKNMIKVSISNPPKKKVLSYPTQAIFAKAFGTGFKMEEKVPDFNIRFKLESANRITEIFGTSPIMAFNKHGDLGLALPVMSISHDIDDQIMRGDLVIPILQTNGITTIFVPDGCDEETPLISLKKILPRLDPIDLPVCYKEGHAVTVKKGDNGISVSAEACGDLQEGDYAVIRGRCYEVYAKNNDDCFTPVEGSHNVIRIKGCFANNVTRQKFLYRKLPLLSDTIIDVEASFLSTYRPVEVTFITNKNGNNHGNAELAFFNVIFNSSGYMTHDRAIPPNAL